MILTSNRDGKGQIGEKDDFSIKGETDALDNFCNSHGDVAAWDGGSIPWRIHPLAPGHGDSRGLD
jgi:hypothetical protein